MRDIAESSVGWLVLAGIVVAIVIGKRRGEQRFASAVSAAKAEARAELQAELGVTQTVQLAVDASHRTGGPAGDSSSWTQAELDAAVLRVLRAGGPGVLAPAYEGVRLPTGVDHYDYDHHYHHVARLDAGTDRVVGAVQPGDLGSDASDSGPGDDGPDPRGVAVVPCASLNEKPDGPELVRRTRREVVRRRKAAGLNGG